jgi:arginase
MELALITGRGPKELSNINNLAPYVTEQNIIHLGQRDATETRKWGAMDLSETAITHYDLATIQKKGILNIVERIKTDMGRSSLDGYWLHFDTDVLSDEVNPAVDYRLSDGLTEKEALFMLREIVNTSMIKGISITIYNPKLDPTGDAGKLISRIIVNAFNEVTNRN